MAWNSAVIITGGTANLGYYAALDIAKALPDCLVVLSSRSDKDHAADKINESLKQKNTIFISLDLADLSNVRRYAEDWVAQNRPTIQCLVLNAGLQFPGKLTKTTDGLEATFGINHVGHALLFHLLCSHLTNNARILITSSGTHDPAQKTSLPNAVYNTAEDLAHPTETMVDVPGRQRYSSSKLANILWTYALHRRISAVHRADCNLTVYAFDPGLMPGTGLARDGARLERFLWMRVMPHIMPLLRLLISPNIHTPRESGAALARLATEKNMERKSGQYFEGIEAIPSSKDSYDEKKQDDLWQWTIAYLAKSDEEQTKFHELR
jgi:NAD(P)-dependent dehydrogenase (short-subunit alcohol dehydrogenase family)